MNDQAVRRESFIDEGIPHSDPLMTLQAQTRDIVPLRILAILSHEGTSFCARRCQGQGKDDDKRHWQGQRQGGQGQGQERTCANNPLATLMLQQWNIDEDDAARAAIRAEADAIPESTVEAIMVEARTRDALMLILDMHRLFANQHGRDRRLLGFALVNLVTATARIRARLLDSAD